MERPSTPLLRLIRDVSRKQGLNTAALAREAGLDRARLKHVLSGAEPMTVDELMALGEALELDAQTLGMLDTSPPLEAPAVTPLGAAPENGEPGWEVDPLGNHAEQALRLGFGLGCDLFVWLSAEAARDSGVPDEVLDKYDERLPIRLDAAFHRHYNPRFEPEAVSLTLSFGTTLYEVRFPWHAFEQVALIPLPPDPDDDVEAENPSGPGRGHLRLVE